jgi:hypothetical protein
MLPQYAALRQQQAQQQLGLGLNIRDFRENQRLSNIAGGLNFMGTTPSGVAGMLNYHLPQRLAQATTHSYGRGNQNQTTTSNPSLMQQIGGWMGLGAQAGGMIGGGITGYNTGGLTGMFSGLRPPTS